MAISKSDIVGTHPLMQKLAHITAKVAKTDATVMLTGESGTGKELVARLVHESSTRVDKPFIA
ncbi:MAG TPA: sigma 54-interacting transcriptional regulator, partial [Candidatus Binatia bacterium]|nr:sigma 54-interacting transcriptional regulator [Candidatus Binatia bacterium]